MTQKHFKNRLWHPHPTQGLMLKAVLLIAVVIVAGAWGSLKAQTATGQIPDITGNYDFLKPYNTLAILQEDQMLKGYIDVLQGKSESDAILSYPIVSGERNGNHVEFTTRIIHEKYYHFSGSVQHGKGKAKGDPDYLELIGELQTIRKHTNSKETDILRQQVIFKSQGRVEKEP